MIIHAIKYLQKEKRLIEQGKTNWTTVEKLDATIKQLEEQEENKIRNMNKEVD